MERRWVNMELYHLENLWFFLILLMLLVYLVLDGFDLGTGIILPFFKDPSHRKILLDKIWPFWDGNEIWLIITGGSLFAVFFPVYIAIMTGLYPIVMLLLFSYILRAVCFEFRNYDEKRRILWENIFSITSYLIVILLGAIIGIIISGVPLNQWMGFAGTMIVIFRPLPVLMALAGVSALFLHALTYQFTSDDSQMNEKLRKYGISVWRIHMILLTLYCAALWNIRPAPGLSILFIVGMVAGLGSTMLLRTSLANGFGNSSFLLSVSGLVGQGLMVAGSFFPYILPATNNSAFSMTIHNIPHSLYSLKYITWFTVIFIVIILIYTSFIYRIFRKNKIKLTYEEHTNENLLIL